MQLVILLAVVVEVLMVLVAAVADTAIVIDTGGERKDAWKTFPKDTKEQVRVSPHPVLQRVQVFSAHCPAPRDKNSSYTSFNRVTTINADFQHVRNQINNWMYFFSTKNESLAIQFFLTNVTDLRITDYDIGNCRDILRTYSRKTVQDKTARHAYKLIFWQTQTDFVTCHQSACSYPDDWRT